MSNIHQVNTAKAAFDIVTLTQKLNSLIDATLDDEIKAITTAKIVSRVNQLHHLYPQALKLADSLLLQLKNKELH